MANAFLIFLSLLFASHPSHSQTLTISTATSDENFLSVPVQWGTPGQSFNVLVDTTDHTSWVYNGSANTDQTTFKSGQSSTFVDLQDTETFSYQTDTATLAFATDTFTISSNSVDDIQFAVATQNFTITDEQDQSGFLGLDRENAIIPALKSNDLIKNQSVTVDVGNNKLYIGEFSASSEKVDDESNATACATTSNDDLSLLWVFDMTLTIDSTPTLSTNTFKGVIDSASPYITIYTTSETNMYSLWQLFDKSSSRNDINCNYTTRLCDDSGDIFSTLSIFISDSNYNVSISADDLVDGDYIQLLYDPDTAYTTGGDTDYVLFLGRPFLKQLVVTLDFDEETMTFLTYKSTSESLDWPMILIVFGSVAAFALLFFLAFYCKFGKIMAPSQRNTEEQSLLRGPVQALGSSNNTVGAASSGGVGVSGLDEDDDAVLQQVQRQSAIESQQRREQQLRMEREEQQRRHDEQQAQERAAASNASVTQGRIGGSAPKPENPDDLRARRLRFLEQQEKQQQQDQ